MIVRVAAVLLAAAAALRAQQGDVPGEEQAELPKDLVVPPAVVHTPAEELATFRLQPGYRLECVASEPLVGDPVVTAFDAAGRPWVVEMRGFMPDVNGTGEDAPNGRIVVLHDDDGDGRMDRSTVFLDGLVLPRGVLPLQGGALVIAPPNLLWCADDNGDLKCDRTEVVAGGFEAGLANPEHAGNGLLWGLDNLVHLANHTFAFRRTRTGFEAIASGGGGQWGLSQDDQGRLYFDYNEDWLRCDLVPSLFAPRSAAMGSLAGTNVRLCPDTSVFPIRITPGVNRGYRPGILKDWTLVNHTSACAPWYCRGDLLPELAGSAFACDSAAHLVRRFVLDEKDGRLTARNPYERAEFLASTDERFRPVHLTGGPDGALWITDMYRGLIQHRNFVTSYLRKHAIARGLEGPRGLGRIWRVLPERAAAVPLRRLDAAGVAACVAALDHPDGWHRDTAQRRLWELGDRKALPLVRTLLRDGAASWRGRVRALWVIAGLGALEREDVVAGLYDGAPEVRVQALRLSPPFLAQGGPVLQALCELCCDRTPPERWQLALALGELPLPRALPLFLALAPHAAGDDVLRSAIANAAAGRELGLLRALLAQGRVPPALLALLARSLAVQREPKGQQELLDLAAARMDRTEVLALLQGMVAALPKGEARNGWYRFAATPQALVAVQRLGDAAITAAAQQLLAAIALDPELATNRELSTAEVVQVGLGAKVYGLVCASCHQPSGNGMGGLAPPLRDSEWVTGDPQRLLRIVLGGVRGKISAAGVTFDNEMPAQATLSDADIAAVLSYVRNAFGHRGSLLRAEDVAAVRALQKGRKDTWTVPELQALK